jgi:hypothetical protein
LFSESNGRFVCELAAADADEFAATLGEPVVVLGTVTAEPVLRLPGWSLPVEQLLSAFTGGAR